MGMFKQKVKISNTVDPAKSLQKDFWVDTGALYSFIPENVLKGLGCEPVDMRNLVLADGRPDRRPFGFCNFEIEGFPGVIPCPVIFAPQDSLFLLGATALENFGVTADPINRKLQPILSVIGGFLASK